MSNVTALPTSPSSGPRAPAGSWRSVISCGSWPAPWATAANAPMPAASISARPITSTCTPSSSRARCRQRLGRERVGRRVAEVARAVGGLGAGAPGLDRRGDVVVRGDDQRRGRAVLARLALEVACSGRRPAACPRPARRRPRRATLCGSSQQSVRAPSSRARPSATAAAIRARSASKSSRAPSPIRIQRRPGGVRVRRACGTPSRASPDSTSAPSAPSSTSCGMPLPSKTPTTIVSAPVSRAGRPWWPGPPSAGGYRQSHAQDRDPRRRPHPRRQARRRTLIPRRPPSWAASPSGPRSSAPAWRPSRCSTS